MQSIPETTTARDDFLALIANRLNWLRDDITNLFELATTYQSCFGAVDQALCDEIGQAGEDILDQLRDIDPAYLAEIDAKAQAAAADTHQRYLDHVVMGREMADYR